MAGTSLPLLWSMCDVSANSEMYLRSCISTLETSVNMSESYPVLQNCRLLAIRSEWPFPWEQVSDCNAIIRTVVK